VQFAGVEQQLKTNEELTSLVTLQQTAQSTQARLVGKTAVVDGSRRRYQRFGDLGYQRSKAPTDLTVTNSPGQTVFSNTYSVKPAQPAICLDGKGNDGTQWPGRQIYADRYRNRQQRPTVRRYDPAAGHGQFVDLTQTRQLLTITAQTTRSTRSRPSVS